MNIVIPYGYQIGQLYCPCDCLFLWGKAKGTNNMMESHIFYPNPQIMARPCARPDRSDVCHGRQQTIYFSGGKKGQSPGQYNWCIGPY